MSAPRPVAVRTGMRANSVVATVIIAGVAEGEAEPTQVESIQSKLKLNELVHIQHYKRVG